jgi:hypothetical protein
MAPLRLVGRRSVKGQTSAQEQNRRKWSHDEPKRNRTSRIQQVLFASVPAVLPRAASAKISVDLSGPFTRLPALQALMNSIIANLNPMPKRAAWLRKVAMGHSVGGGKSNH